MVERLKRRRCSTPYSADENDDACRRKVQACKPETTRGFYVDAARKSPANGTAAYPSYGWLFPSTNSAGVRLAGRVATLPRLQWQRPSPGVERGWRTLALARVIDRQKKKFPDCGRCPRRSIDRHMFRCRYYFVRRPPTATIFAELGGLPPHFGAAARGRGRSPSGGRRSVLLRRRAAASYSLRKWCRLSDGKSALPALLDVKSRDYREGARNMSRK